MKIDKNSHGTLAVVYAVILAVILAGMILKAPTWLWIIIYVFSLVFGVWQTLFFRVPNRKKHGDSRRVSSVADGKVVIIDRIFEKENEKLDEGLAEEERLQREAEALLASLGIKL